MSRDNNTRGRVTGRDSGRTGGRSQGMSAEAVKRRLEENRSGDFDKYINQDVKMFRPHDGDNNIRILPPTFESKDNHWGMDAYVHYGVGSDEQTYLCANKMNGESCPICDEQTRAHKSGDTEYADKLKPTKRVLVYLIDRDNEKDGPMIWNMPVSLDNDLLKLSVDKRTGDVLNITDPEDGYDIEFEKQGKGTRTKYAGIAIARRSSDLGDDRWMDFVEDHPIPDLLQFYEYDHIAKVFGGDSSDSSSSHKGGRSSRDEDMDDQQERDLRKSEGRPSSKGRSTEPELDWDSVHEMTFDELVSIIDSNDLKIKPDDSKDDEELADWICEDMNISKKPVGRRASSSDSEGESKLNAMRNRRNR